MSKFETALSKTISLDSNTFNDQNFAVATEPQSENRSTKNDIYRYSYNLGNHRVAKIQRTASVGGNALQSMDGSLARLMLGRKGMARSLSMGSQIGLKTNNEMDDTNNNGIPVESNLQSNFSRSLPLDETKSSEKAAGKEIENLTQPASHPTVKDLPDNSPPLTTANSAKEYSNEATNISDGFIKKSHGFSDSVPDLRSTRNSENDLPLEGFPSLFNHDIDQPQSRAICKLRRAARRLGVSLSTEELYHRQRRNGVCSEIDDAAENRKLLRVLNKRF